MNITDKTMMMYSNSNLDKLKSVSEKAGRISKENKELKEAGNFPKYMVRKSEIQKDQ